jgi:sugar lactone lactonase YvrE
MNRVILLSISILSLLILSLQSKAQLAIGQWRDHFSYNNVHSLADNGNLIYCACDLGIFTFDKSTSEIEKLGKIQGLTESEIKSARYNNSTNCLFITYKNSNIDIIKDNKIYNFPDIKRKQINGNKEINKITFFNNFAYLSCGFGIVVFDTENMEFSDTWYIGSNATLVNVYDFAQDNTYFYAATDIGLLKAEKTNTNLADYRNWQQMTLIPNYNNPVTAVFADDQKIYLSQKTSNGNTQILKIQGENWNLFDTQQYTILSISEQFGKLIVTDKNSIKIFGNEILETDIHQYAFDDTLVNSISLNDSYLENENLLRIGDTRFGLVTYNFSGTTFDNLSPDGPLSNYIGQIAVANGKIYSTPGGYSSALVPLVRKPEISIYDKINTLSIIPSECWHDVYSIYPNPFDSHKFFMGAWGDGLFEYENNKLINHYTQTNSSLQYMGAIPGTIRIASIKYDKDKNLWISNATVNNPISVLSNKGNWLSYNFGGTLTLKPTGQILITSSGNIWVQIQRGGGMFAFNSKATPENPDDDEYSLFYPKISNDNSIAQVVNCIAEDKDEDIWVGTDQGVVVYHSPENVFSETDFYADRIQLTAVGNDTTEQYLLFTENVTSIAVDGANRKWIGTSNSGVFLVSPDGRNEIYHFSQDNSLLPSNSIVDIKIDPESGEVYFGTDNGMVAFRAEATEGGENFGNIYTFPNPVRPDYSGIITITGLLADANVKITDISGNLVFETTTLGGQAIWNGKTFSGNRVNTGVYLVFCANNDGTKAMVTKILFVN